MMNNLPREGGSASVFGRLFYYNDIFGLTSLQRVYCEHYGLKKLITQNSVIIDVGAHIGQFTFFCSHYLQARRIISIEPLVKCFNLLKLNAREPNDCMNKAVSTRQGGLTIHISKTSTQMSTSVKSSQDTYDGNVDIPTVTLDEIENGADLDRVDLLKVDTEGSEYDVLCSGRHALNKVGVIVVETSILRESAGNIFKTGTLLEENHFVLRELDCFKAVNPSMANAVFEKSYKDGSVSRETLRSSSGRT